LGATGEETIYRGILWMKEKYEEYRRQADQRYERLRDELGRSEQRYQDLFAVMEQDKKRALAAAGEMTVNAEYTVDAAATVSAEPGMVAPGMVASEMVASGMVASEMVEPAARVVIDELKVQLLAERMKVEELVAILQANTQMLRKVIPDLGK
jgi:hypothetical protein